MRTHIAVRELLSTYNPPTIFDLIDNIQSQRESVTCNVTDHWTELIKEQAKAKVTLKYLHIEGFRPKSMHPLWTPNDTTHIGIIRSCNMAKVIVGRYYLEVDYAKF